MKSILTKKTDAVILLSGLMKLKPNIKIPEGFIEFDTHTNLENADFTKIEFLKHLFSSQFIDNLLPKKNKGLFNKKVRSYTKTINQNYIFHNEENEYTVPIIYLDLFTFTNNTLIYSIKVAHISPV